MSITNLMINLELPLLLFQFFFIVICYCVINVCVYCIPINVCVYYIPNIVAQLHKTDSGVVYIALQLFLTVVTQNSFWCSIHSSIVISYSSYTKLILVQYTQLYSYFLQQLHKTHSCVVYRALQLFLYRLIIVSMPF